MPQVLLRLLALSVDGVTERLSRLRQCLSVFAEVYAPVSAAHRRCLAAALLPAARRVAAGDPKQAALLMLLTLKALQVGGADGKVAGQIYGARRRRRRACLPAGGLFGVADSPGPNLICFQISPRMEGKAV
jgi:Nuclear condensing complex subunits, C-term domain